MHRFVSETEHAGDRGVPWKHDEGVGVGQRDHFARADSATNQFSLAGRLQVGHGGAVKGDALFEVSTKVPCGDHLGDHLGANGGEHVIDEFDAGRGDFLLEVFDDIGLHVGGLVTAEGVIVREGTGAELMNHGGLLCPWGVVGEPV